MQLEFSEKPAERPSVRRGPWAGGQPADAWPSVRLAGWLLKRHENSYEKAMGMHGKGPPGTIAAVAACAFSFFE